MFNAKDILSRYKSAQTHKDQWRNTNEEVYEYALPQRNLYDGDFEQGSAGQQKGKRVFDSTGVNSTQRFANRVQSGLFPPGRKWCRLEAGNAVPEELKPVVQEKLDEYTDKMFDMLRLTNFDLAMGEFLLDLAVGTAAMTVESGDESTPVRYSAIPQYLVSIEEGTNGNIDNVYRRLRMKGEAIQSQWPTAKIPADMAQRIKDKPTENVELIEAAVYNYGERQYEYHLITAKGDHHLVQKKMRDSPWVIGRFMKVAGEIYGRGPLMTAIYDIKTLNKVVEFLLKNASIGIAGVYTATDDGVMNPQNIKIVPGAVIPVARNGGPQGPSLQPLKAASDINLTQLVINDLRMSIKKTLLDESLPPDNMSARSATEVVERMKELSQNLGSAFGRLVNETMVPIVSKTLAVMNERGMIDLPLKINGLEVKVVPTSPLAQAQNLEEISEFMQYAQMVSMLGQEGQLAVDVGESTAWVGDKLGIPQKLRRSPEEIQAKIAEGMQMAMEAEEQQPGIVQQVMGNGAA